MLTFFKRLLGLAPTPVETQQEVEANFVPPKPQRAKDAQGRFQADDPATPENEAWVGGVAPVKTTAKVRAITNTDPGAVNATKPANKRRTRNRNKVRAASGTAAKTTDSHVKPAQVAKSKPAKPKASAVKK
jgi:hypothetical protein